MKFLFVLVPQNKLQMTNESFTVDISNSKFQYVFLKPPLVLLNGRFPHPSSPREWDRLKNGMYFTLKKLGHQFLNKFFIFLSTLNNYTCCSIFVPGPL